MRIVTYNQASGLAHMAAGIGSGAVMRRAEHVVMPSQEIEWLTGELVDDFMGADAVEFTRRSIVRECAILAGAATLAAPVIRWIARRLTNGW